MSKLYDRPRLSLESATPDMRVAYAPVPAQWDPNAVEYGTISSVNAKYVFVKFDKTVARLGWVAATAQACDPSDLVEV